VLAAPAAVPGSAWFVVAKLESAEAFASLRRTGWMLAGVPAVWVVCLGLGAWLSRGGLRTQLLRQELAGEQERAGLQERIAALLRQSQDIILLTDQHWKILEANERALAAYGHPLARLRQMSLRDLVPAKLRGDFEKQLAGLRPNSGLVIDVQQQRKDGTNFAAKGSFQVVAFAGVRYCQAMLREL
jgi:PAS domain S-box-containing protein